MHKSQNQLFEHQLNFLDPNWLSGLRRWRSGKKNLLANAGAVGDSGSIPESRIAPGIGNGNTFQYSCLENFTDRGGETVHRMAKIQTQLSMHIHNWLSNFPLNMVTTLYNL